MVRGSLLATAPVRLLAWCPSRTGCQDILTRLIDRGRSSLESGRSWLAGGRRSRRPPMRGGRRPFRVDLTDPSLPALLVTLAGIATLVIGTVAMQATPLDFTVLGALGGVVSQLGTTLPAAVSIGLAATLEVLCGAVLIRIIRRSAFTSLGEATLFGLVGAVAKDTMLLLSLGAVGHFNGLSVVLVDVCLLAATVLLRPFIQRPAIDPRIADPTSPTSRMGIAWLLPVVIWAIPLTLQLASPVVPFLDVLPNHVAPVEHIGTYASWDRLAVSPSPIYGPSRLFLGYAALLGALTAMTGLSAALAVAAFALPLTVLLAVGGYHVCRVLAGPTAAFWSLLTVPLTFTFLRLPDARATVLAFPLAAICLALTLPDPRDDTRRTTLGGRSRPILVAMALGAAVTVHPVIGSFAAAAVAILALSRAAPLRRAILAGLVGGGLVALPQAAIMLGFDLPSWVGLPAWPAGALAAAWLGGPAPRRGTLTELAAGPVIGLGPFVLGLVAFLAAAGAGAYAVLSLDPGVSGRLADSVAATILDYPLLLLGLLVAVLTVRSVGAWLLLGGVLLVGLAAMGVANVFPTETLLGRSIRFELPKSVGYWLPWATALAGALGLGWLWSRDAWPVLARAVFGVTFVVAAAFPYHVQSVEVLGIEEHRYAESAAIALSAAESGYWRGFRDTRLLVDADGAALIAAVRAEQASGRMGHTSTLLHLAPSFQQWVVTPLGVLTGVIETSATPDPEVSLHTAGGRLRDISSLAESLAEDPDYVVVEGLPDAAAKDSVITAAGYCPSAQGGSWTLYRAMDVSGRPVRGAL